MCKPRCAFALQRLAAGLALAAAMVTVDVDAARAQSANNVVTSVPEKAHAKRSEDIDVTTHPLYLAKRKHLLHMAKIDRIEALGRVLGDYDIVARAVSLRPLEQRRFRKALARTFARLGYTGS